MHIHHRTFMVIFIPQSWYGRDWKMPTTGHPSQCPESICLSAYFNIKFWYFWRLNKYFSDGTVYWQPMDSWMTVVTRGYHIKPTNSTCNMISGVRLIGPCSSVRGQNTFFSVQSNFNYCRKVLSKKNIWINLKTKICTPNSVLRWEFASV